MKRFTCVLEAAAWHYRHRPTVGQRIKARRAGKPPEVLGIAQKADARLNRKFRRMVDRGKRTTTAAVATARGVGGIRMGHGAEGRLTRTARQGGNAGIHFNGG